MINPLITQKPRNRICRFRVMMAQSGLGNIMVGTPSRLTIIFCGVVTLLLSRPYRMLQGFDAYTRTQMPWTAFSVALILIGALAILLALIPRPWIVRSHEKESQVGWSAPTKLLAVFALCAYMVVVGVWFVRPAGTFPPVVAFSICPACVLTITVDPSFRAVVLLLAPLSAAVYGSLGAVLGFFRLILESRKSV